MEEQYLRTLLSQAGLLQAVATNLGRAFVFVAYPPSPRRTHACVGGAIGEHADKPDIIISAYIEGIAFNGATDCIDFSISARYWGGRSIRSLSLDTIKNLWRLHLETGEPAPSPGREGTVIWKS